MKSNFWKLISELMKDSRRSDRELAKAIGVSQPTVHRMLRRLDEEGYVKEFTVIPDFCKLGYNLLALIFVKLKGGLSAEGVAEARRVAQESLKKGPREIVMLERGMGLGYDGVIVSFHEDYASYLKLKKWLNQFTFLEMARLDSFLVNLDDEVRYRHLTFSTLATHLLTLKETE